MMVVVDKKKFVCSVFGCEVRFIRYVDFNKYLEVYQRQVLSIDDGYV